MTLATVPRWINGRRHEPPGERLPVLDPATGEPLSEVALADDEVVKQAVASALSAFPARRFQRDAQAGMIGVNVPIPVPVGPYGAAGWKDSAFGDTALNNGAWRFYTQSKYVTSRWDGASAGIDLGFRPN